MIDNPSKNQQKASNPLYSVWVSASAGTGKTKILVDRLLRLLLSGVSIDNILCITYSKAAAQEMINRLMSILSQWSIMAEEDLKQALQDISNEKPSEEQLNLAKELFTKIINHPKELKIQTIHSFCQNLLARFPIEANIPPHFLVIEEDISQGLKKQAIDKIISEQMENSRVSSSIENILASLSKNISQFSFERIINNILSYSEKLELISMKYNVDSSLETLKEEIYKYLQADIGVESTSILENYFNNLDYSDLLECLKIFQDKNLSPAKLNIVALYEFIKQPTVKKVEQFETWKSFFLTKEEKSKQKLFSKEIIEKLEDKGDFILSTVTSITDNLLEVIKKFKATTSSEINFAIMQIALAIYKQYQKLKYDNGYLDFSDLIMKTYELLNNPGLSAWIMYKLDQKIDHILVDESQDTSPMQWEIIKALMEEFFSGESAKDDSNRTIFVVGDIKQSIYSFQGADPYSFSKTREYLKNKIENANKPFLQVAMNTSFRSAQGVIDMVNCVSRNIFDTSKSPYLTEEITHNVFYNDKPFVVEVWPLIYIDKKQEENEREETNGEKVSQDNNIGGLLQQDLTKLQERQVSALGVQNNELALHIKENEYDKSNQDNLQNTKVVLDKQNNNKTGDKFQSLAQAIVKKIEILHNQQGIPYGDILILYRKRLNNITLDYIVKLLKDKNIPVLGIDKINLKNNIAIKDLIALAKFLSQTKDSFSLSCLLKSPIFNLKDEDIFNIIHYNSNADAFYNLSYTHCEIYNILSSWLNMVDYKSVFDLFFHILYKDTFNDETNITKFIKRLGLDVLDPLMEFMNLIFNFKTKNEDNLQSFIKFLENYDSEIKREVSNNKDSINLMSIHGSKGLQSRVVFLLNDLDNKPPKKDIMFNGEINNPLLIISPKKEIKSQSIKDLEDFHKNLDLEESKRLLYVAITRAEEHLYVASISNIKDIEEKNKDSHQWYKAITENLNGVLIEEEDNFFDEKLGFVSKKVLRTQNIVRPNSKKAQELQIEIPTWVFSKAPIEPSPTKPLTPSKLIFEEPYFASPLEVINLKSIPLIVNKGAIIHKILEQVNYIAPEDYDIFIDSFLSRQQISIEDKLEIKQNVDNIIKNPEFNFIFSNKSLNEVSLSGAVMEDNTLQMVSARVDKLIILEKEIIIIDYKYSQKKKIIPVAYQKQIILYKKLLSNIYKNYTIRGFILFSQTPALVEVE